MYKNDPLVSVIMCVYNGERHLAEAIKGILDQELSDFEFIIVNDGSLDSSQQIIDVFNDQRIIKIVQERMGLTRSLNKALAIARGRYVARQDADDISRPARFYKQVEYLENHKDVTLIGTGVILIDKEGQKLREYIYPVCHRRLCKQLLSLRNPIPHSTIMFRRSLIIALGGYDEQFYKAQDYELYLRLIESHKIASIPEPLVKLRYICDSLTFKDNQADQLKCAIFARMLVTMRQKHYNVNLHSSDWQSFVQQFERWFEASSLQNIFSAAKFKREAMAEWHRGDYFGCIHSVYDFFSHNPALIFKTWSVHRKYWNQNIENQILEIADRCKVVPVQG